MPRPDLSDPDLSEPGCRPGLADNPHCSGDRSLPELIGGHHPSPSGFAHIRARQSPAGPTSAAPSGLIRPSNTRPRRSSPPNSRRWAISCAHLKRGADRTLPCRRNRAKFNRRLWHQPDGYRGAQHMPTISSGCLAQTVCRRAAPRCGPGGRDPALPLPGFPARRIASVRRAAMAAVAAPGVTEVIGGDAADPLLSRDLCQQAGAGRLAGPFEPHTSGFPDRWRNHRHRPHRPDISEMVAGHLNRPHVRVSAWSSGRQSGGRVPGEGPRAFAPKT